MSETDQNVVPNNSSGFSKIKKDLLKHKRLYFVVLPVVLVLTVLYTLTKPNIYTCTVKLSPELSSTRTNSSLSSLASGLGIDIGSALGNTQDALRPAIYPEVMSSVNYRAALLNVRVKRKDGEEFSYYDYLNGGQKPPLISFSLSSLLGSLFASPDTLPDKKDIDPYRLTKKQSRIASLIRNKVSCAVNKKTNLITIQVTDGDPEVCATIADSAMALLQKFITDYRTSKARVDLEYSQKMLLEAKEKYEKTSKAYARNVDANLNSFVEEVRQRRLNMETELQVQRTIYQQVAARAKQAELKVQEDTPAFAVVQASTVPVKKSGPKRSLICLSMLFLAFIASTIYILYKEDDLKTLLSVNMAPRRRYQQ